MAKVAGREKAKKKAIGAAAVFGPGEKKRNGSRPLILTARNEWPREGKVPVVAGCEKSKLRSGRFCFFVAGAGCCVLLGLAGVEGGAGAGGGEMESWPLVFFLR